MQAYYLNALLWSLALSQAHAILGYAGCFTACNAQTKGCYSAAGAVFGAGPTTANTACDTAQGICMKTCTAFTPGDTALLIGGLSGAAAFQNLKGISKLIGEGFSSQRLVDEYKKHIDGLTIESKRYAEVDTKDHEQLGNTDDYQREVNKEWIETAIEEHRGILETIQRTLMPKNEKDKGVSKGDKKMGGIAKALSLSEEAMEWFGSDTEKYSDTINNVLNAMIPSDKAAEGSTELSDDKETGQKDGKKMGSIAQALSMSEGAMEWLGSDTGKTDDIINGILKAMIPSDKPEEGSTTPSKQYEKGLNEGSKTMGSIAQALAAMELLGSDTGKSGDIVDGILKAMVPSKKPVEESTRLSKQNDKGLNEGSKKMGSIAQALAAMESLGSDTGKSDGTINDILKAMIPSDKSVEGSAIPADEEEKGQTEGKKMGIIAQALSAMESLNSDTGKTGDTINDILKAMIPSDKSVEKSNITPEENKKGLNEGSKKMGSIAQALSLSEGAMEWFGSDAGKSGDAINSILKATKPSDKAVEGSDRQNEATKDQANTQRDANDAVRAALSPSDKTVEWVNSEVTKHKDTIDAISKGITKENIAWLGSMLGSLTKGTQTNSDSEEGEL